MQKSQRTAKCGHVVPSHPGRQRLACEVCRPGQKWGHCDPRLTRMAACGHEAPYNPGMQRRYCDACNPKLATRLCGTCGVDISQRRGNAKFCSHMCSEVFRGHRAPKGTLTSRICALDGCDAVFTPWFRKQVCCNQAHGKTYWRITARAEGRDDAKAKPETRRKHSRIRTARRRAAVRDPDAEKIDVWVVGDRDGWACGICDLPVDRDLAYPDPLSKSLDHVLPLSLGGLHRMGNVRISHLRCNVLRGNKVDLAAGATSVAPRRNAA